MADIVNGGRCGRFTVEWWRQDEGWKVVKLDENDRVVDQLNMSAFDREPDQTDFDNALSILCSSPSRLKPKRGRRRRARSRTIMRRPSRGKSGSSLETDVDRVRQAFRRKVSTSPGEGVYSIVELRRAVPGMSKARFDAAVVALSDRDEVALHLHDLPAALPKSERDKLVLHPDGTYFIGIAPRRSR